MLPNVLISNTQKDLLLSTSSIRKVIREVLLFKKKSTHEVSIYLVSEEKICLLHEEFFNDSRPTDCISLPMDESFDEFYHILGEVFICPKTAIEYAKARNLCVYEEVTLYIVHGLLHLMGYDDIAPKDRKAMRYQERKIMQHLKNSDCLVRQRLEESFFKNPSRKKLS